MLNKFCFHLYAQKSPSHFHTLTLSHSHTLSRHAEQLLFSCLGSKVAVYSRKWQWFFLDLLIITLSTDIRVSRAGSQLKIQLFGKVTISCTIYVLGDVLTDKYLHDNVPPDMVGNVNLIGEDLIYQLEQLAVSHFLQHLVNVQLLNVVLRIHSFVKS